MVRDPDRDRLGIFTIQSILDLLNSIPTTKTITIFVETVTTAFPPGTRPYQHGGTVTSQWALVGEAGPELVQLPLGSRVFSHPETIRLLTREGSGDGAGTTHIEATSGLTINFYGDIHVRREQDIDDLVNRIDFLLGKRSERARRVLPFDTNLPTSP